MYYMVNLKGKIAGLKPLGKAVNAATVNNRYEVLAGKIKLLVSTDGYRN